MKLVLMIVLYRMEEFTITTGTMYKLKQVPEDFVVIEIPALQKEKQGKYLYFWMKKKGFNTIDAVKEVARQLRIKEKQIGFAGSKDRKSTRLNSSHMSISYAVFCLKKNR